MITKRYNYGAIIFHWLSALLIFFVLVWGWYMVELPQGVDRSFSFSLHKSLGMSAFLLFIIRAVWRVLYAPAPIVVSTYMESIAEKAHRYLYVLMFLTPTLGYLSASFTKYEMKYFGIKIPKFGWENPAINDFFCQLHHAATWCLTALIIVHIGGVVIHTIRGDGAVRRMIP